MDELKLAQEILNNYGGESDNQRSYTMGNCDCAKLAAKEIEQRCSNIYLMSYLDVVVINLKEECSQQRITMGRRI